MDYRVLQFKFVPLKINLKDPGVGVKEQLEKKKKMNQKLSRRPCFSGDEETFLESSQRRKRRKQWTYSEGREKITKQ